MATIAAIAEIDANARKQLRDVVLEVSAALDVDPPQSPSFARQPELQRAYELQTFADWLESVRVALIERESEAEDNE